MRTALVKFLRRKICRCLLGFLCVGAILPAAGFALDQRLPPEAGVSRALAKQRFEQIFDVRYRLNLTLVPKAEKIRGSQEISFALKSIPPELVVDFRDSDAAGNIVNGKIGNLAVNGKAVEGYRQVNGHLLIAGKNLKIGANVVALDFETSIAAAGRPLVRFTDSSDGREYIYSLLTPADASLVFPCFDQPDLKARFSLETTAPESWTVVSNALVAAQKPAAAVGYRRTAFQETLPLSTYLFAFAAGEFREIKNENAPVPSTLFVRRSQFEAARAEADEIFRTTNAGIRWMIDYFDFEFPFPKYDLVLLPGFAFRGMEHAGATFLREDAIVFRSQPTAVDRLNRSVLILHELAHQWFGDTVTMRWFDDLWLKEGFANYIAFAALAADSERPETIWKRFYQNFKPDAYEADRTPGTTALRQRLTNLKDAKSVYGAVVYTKAPAILRQLHYSLGDRDFRRGVQIFLRRHRFANADWTDFVRSFETASGGSLRDFSSDYIVRRGVSVIETEWRCDSAGNEIEHLSVAQRDALGAPQPRTIKAQLLLAYDDAPPVTISYVLSTRKKTIKDVVGRRCPVFVFANYEDYGYGYFLLDERSRAAIAGRVARLPDPFLRSVLWGALWEAVRAAEMPPLEFARLILENQPREPDEDLARNQLEYLIRTYLRYLAPAQQPSVGEKIENLCREGMSSARSEGQKINYFNCLLTVAKSAAAREFLKNLLAGRTSIPKVEIRQGDRWRIVAALVAAGDEDADALLRAEQIRDAGGEAKKQIYIVNAGRPDAATKRRYFNDYLSNRGLPEDWIENSLQNFNRPDQSALTLPYLTNALAALPRLKRTRKIFFLNAWLRAFVGGQQNARAAAQIEQFLKKTRLDADLRLKILAAADDLKRAALIRRKFRHAKTSQTPPIVLPSAVFAQVY